MANESPELKPCPFCGGRAVMQASADLPFAYCESCDSNGSECDSLLAAAQWWNARTPPKVKPEDVLDATHEYLTKVYGSSPLAHPVDRRRILSALE